MSGMLDASIEKRFVRGPAIRGSLRCPTDRFHVTVVAGPSGSGKTTLLRCLAGLERPDSGHVRFADETWCDMATRRLLPPQARGVGFMFQEPALFPHLSVADNVGYGLRTHAVAARRRIVAGLLDRLGLSGLATRRPHELSGGEQQRVALARTLAPRPRLLLLDEPLSALDPDLRADVRHQLRDWLADCRTPVVLVTHDRADTELLADDVVIMPVNVESEAELCTSVPAYPGKVRQARGVSRREG
jgi:molybdate transport system ATP-binding protein